MKRFLLLAVCALTIGTAHAQTKGKADTGQQTLINELIRNLETNPDNPLKVDQKLLLDVANAMPEGPLKSKLLSYSVNLGVDENLSMRQIYWDLNTAYSTNTDLAKLAPLAKTGKNLDMLLNQTDVLASQINSKVANYQPGVFMTDPYFLSNLQQITGSESSAATMSIGLDLALAFKQEFAKVKAYKEEYKTYAEMSTHMLHLEVDRRLGKALIDATVDRTPHNMITPMYRYDFTNGSSIRVENGILKYFNKNNDGKELVSVENRNNGKSYQTVFSGSIGGIVHPQLIYVSPLEDKFLIQAGKVDNETKCKSCFSKNDSYLINTQTGEFEKFRHSYFLQFDNLPSSTLNQENFVAFRFPGGKNIISHSIDLNKGKMLTNNLPINLNSRYIISSNGKTTDILGGVASRGYKYFQAREIGEYIVDLRWHMEVAQDKTEYYSSSYLEVLNKERKSFNTNTLVNELTGITTSKENILYFTTAKGGVGKVDLKGLKDLDKELPEAMKQNQIDIGLEAYTYSNQYKYIFQSLEYDYYSHPNLTLTPDEKHLVYTVGNILYIIDVHKLNAPKKFILTVDPFHIFFAKENGEPTMYVQAFNEFEFHVTKKYDLNKLINAPEEAKKPAAKPTTTTKPQPAKKSATDGSVADEIRKLKALLDDGSITQQEFDQAKKKLLNN